ncbi:MAG: thiol:disulfide interchange protein DsbG [Agitococcus sp.]|nr:thiol:disulfide interchange protein DsbG [Agitococcus sp.]
MKKITHLIAAIATATVSLSVFAGIADVPSFTVPDALKVPVQGGLKIEKKFKAEGGLDGWILSHSSGVNSTNVVAFTSNDGTVAIVGNMFNVKGENLTDKYLEKYAPKKTYTKFWPRLENSAYLAEGATGAEVKSVVYVFMDPSCGYCRLEWKALQPYEKVGLQVRWIPVAFLAPDSINKAAALLVSSDVANSMQELHQGGNKKFTGLSAISADLKIKLEANKRLMEELGFKGTPAALYKDAKGNVLAVDGMPKLSQIPAMTGLPEQAQTDADLARYR